MNDEPLEFAEAMVTIKQGMALAKCHRCGCMASALAQAADVLSGQDREAIHAYQAQMEEIDYDCLGCARCWGAEATIQLTEQYGERSSCCADAHCECHPNPAEAAIVRVADPTALRWPPYPGDYQLGNSVGTVAICTLSDRQLPAALFAHNEPAIAITGRCDTENIGIEKIVLNLISRPQIRWLILCGTEAPGHRAGDALMRLAENGVDAQMRIVGAAGWRPLLKNVVPEEVARFREQITMVDHLGVTEVFTILAAAHEAAASPAAPLATWASGACPRPVAHITAQAPFRLQLDPGGYFVVLLNREAGTISCEHYANTGVLQHIIEGTEGALIAATVVERGLVTRLDHAAYLGRELAKAEMALTTGISYEQDAALGELSETEEAFFLTGDHHAENIVDTDATEPCPGQCGCRHLSA